MTGISCKTTYPITGLVEKTIKHITHETQFVWEH